MADAPFTAAEVEAAVSFFVVLSPLRYATADGVADQAATQVLADLPDGYVDQSLAEQRAVTPGSATSAYRSVVDLEDVSLVVVGHAESLADGLRDSGFADLEILHPELRAPAVAQRTLLGSQWLSFRPRTSDQLPNNGLRLGGSTNPGPTDRDATRWAGARPR